MATVVRILEDIFKNKVSYKREEEREKQEEKKERQIKKTSSSNTLTCLVSLKKFKIVEPEAVPQEKEEPTVNATTPDVGQQPALEEPMENKIVASINTSRRKKRLAEDTEQLPSYLKKVVYTKNDAPVSLELLTQSLLSKGVITKDIADFIAKVCGIDPNNPIQTNKEDEIDISIEYGKFAKENQTKKETALLSISKTTLSNNIVIGMDLSLDGKEPVFNIDSFNEKIRDIVSEFKKE